MSHHHPAEGGLGCVGMGTAEGFRTQWASRRLFWLEQDISFLSWLEDIITQGSFKGPFSDSSQLLLVGLTPSQESSVTKRSHWEILLSDALLWRYPPLQAPSVSLPSLWGHLRATPLFSPHINVWMNIQCTYYTGP